jgi:hypothetical protein
MFHTHPTTTAILKTAKKIYQPEFQHVAHYPNGGFAVSDKYRLFWANDISGEPTLPTAPDLKYTDITRIIPVELNYNLSFQFQKSYVRPFKAFLAVAKLTYNNTCKIEIQQDKIIFSIEDISLGLDSKLTFKMDIYENRIADFEDLSFNLNLEYLTDFLLSFEFGANGFNMFEMYIKQVNGVTAPIILTNSTYNYLMALQK